MQIQELISRGRFIFSQAPKRLEVFKLINGKRSSKEIARKTGRSLSSVLNDTKMMNDYELIRPKADSKGNSLKKEGSVVYEKTPLVRHIHVSNFQGISRTQWKTAKEGEIKGRRKGTKLRPLSIPPLNMILDICRDGESQIYEFKDPRVKISKISKEIAAFLHTRNGGILFYGIEDDGSIVGSDLRRQVFDQSLQNSIRNTISPQPHVEIKEVEVLGYKIIMVIIPPWDRKSLYQYGDGRFYIRKGTNVFVVKPHELKKLSKAQYID